MQPADKHTDVPSVSMLFYPDRDEILDFYLHTCVVCFLPAVCVHEIQPKSQRKDWQAWENRVPLCNACHTVVHKVGAKFTAATLIRDRDRMLHTLHKSLPDRGAG